MVIRLDELIFILTVILYKRASAHYQSKVLNDTILASRLLAYQEILLQGVLVIQIRSLLHIPYKQSTYPKVFFNLIQIFVQSIGQSWANLEIVHA